MKSTATIILIVIVSVICLVLVGSVFSWIGAHNGLVNREEVIPQAESNVNATRATMANKLANVLNILYNTYDSSYLTQVGVAEARNQYDKAQGRLTASSTSIQATRIGYRCGTPFKGFPARTWGAPPTIWSTPSRRSSRIGATDWRTSSAKFSMLLSTCPAARCSTS